MQIRQMSLKNFGCFSSTSISFDPSLTVIVGNNASGKTTILKALSVGIGAYLSGISLESMKAPGIETKDIRYETVVTGNVSERQKQLPVKISMEGLFSDHGIINWERVRNTLKGKTTVLESKPVAEIGKEYQERLRRGDDTLILPVIGYYGTERLWVQKRDDSRNPQFERLSGYIDCLNGKSNEKLMLKWFKNRSWREYEMKNEDFQLQVVKNTLSEVFEKLTGISYARILHDPQINELVLDYKDKNGRPVSRNFSTLSDGYRELMSLMADIAWRTAVLNPQLKNPPKETPGVVMIDEIELHLHPKWQTVILDVLHSIFPSIQFIVTTHSPMVIQSVPQSKLRILAENDSVFQPIQTQRGQKLDSILENVMDAETRPEDVRELFSKLEEAMDAEQWENARNVLTALQNIVGDTDPDVLKQETILNFEQANS